MRACNTRNVRCNIVIRLCNHDARNDVYLRLLPELHTYKIVRRLIIRLKMVIVIISLSVWIPINDGIRFSTREMEPFFPSILYERRGKKRKRNLYNFVSKNFLQVAQRESLCCLLSRISFSTSSAFSEFFTATIHRRSTFGFVFPSRLEFALLKERRELRALRPSNALRFAWPRARTRGQRVHTYAKSGQDRCEPATWATC